MPARTFHGDPENVGPIIPMGSPPLDENSPNWGHGCSKSERRRNWGLASPTKRPMGSTMTDTAKRSGVEGGSYRLDDRYRATDGRVLLTGVQALARLPARSAQDRRGRRPQHRRVRQRLPRLTARRPRHRNEPGHQAGARAALRAPAGGQRGAGGHVGHGPPSWPPPGPTPATTGSSDSGTARPPGSTAPGTHYATGCSPDHHRWVEQSCWWATTRPASHRPCRRRPTPRSSISTCPSSTRARWPNVSNWGCMRWRCRGRRGCGRR